MALAVSITISCRSTNLLSLSTADQDSRLTCPTDTYRKKHPNGSLRNGLDPNNVDSHALAAYMEPPVPKRGPKKMAAQAAQASSSMVNPFADHPPSELEDTSYLALNHHSERTPIAPPTSPLTPESTPKKLRKRGAKKMLAQASSSKANPFVDHPASEREDNINSYVDLNHPSQRTPMAPSTSPLTPDHTPKKIRRVAKDGTCPICHVSDEERNAWSKSPRETGLLCSGCCEFLPFLSVSRVLTF